MHLELPFKLGSPGFAVVLGVGAAAPTPKTTEIPNEPYAAWISF
jgi:hypothetical protein